MPFTTVSGRPIERLYTPTTSPASTTARDLGDPGAFPYTRGIHPTGYRGKLWTMRQFAGFGTPEETNARYKALLQAGGTGLSVAFDLPTLMGRDPDHELVARRSRQVRRQHRLARRHGAALRRHPPRRHHDVDDDQLAGADDLRDVPGGGRKAGRGLEAAVGDDPERHPQGIHRAEGVHLPAARVDAADHRHLHVLRAAKCRAGTRCRSAAITSARRDRRRCRSWRSRCATASSMSSTASTPGSTSTTSRRGISFFFNSHSDFFEEIAKFRAARKLWAEVMRDRFEARDERSWKLRFHTQTAGVSLTAQQPYNNVVRTALQALAAVLGGTNSLHTNSLDEALALPTEEAATLALRTQQIIAHESGVTDVVDPLGGSYFVERLTLRHGARREGVFRDHRSPGRDGRGDRRGLSAARDRRGLVQVPAGRRAARQGDRRRQRLRAGRRAAGADSLHRRHALRISSCSGSSTCAGAATTTRSAARWTRCARPRAARRIPWRRCSTACAPTPRSARCAMRCATCGVSTRVPLYV